MTTVSYEASGHRLRIGGGCQEDDNSTLQNALETFADLAGGHHIVDLTAVTEIDQRVADELMAAARRSMKDGRTVAFIRKHGTLVDYALLAAAEGTANQA
jgi:hypothetical protein